MVLKKQWKAVLFAAAAAAILLIPNSKAAAADTVEKQLYQLTTNKAADAIHLTIATGMDCQNLGIFMPAGSKIQIRIKNASEFGGDLHLVIMNNGTTRNIDTTVPADGSWVTAEATSDSVPFIRTPLNASVLPVIEYSTSGGAKELVYYKDGVTSQQDFIMKWLEAGDSFAVLENDAFTLLVPKSDLKKLVANQEVEEGRRFNSLKELFQYYTDMRTIYDQLAGLTDTSPSSVDYNPGGKFFVRADINGGGTACTNGQYMSMTSYMIQSDGYPAYGFLCRDWMSLHETGHSYETGITGSTITIGEIGTNVFAHYYEQYYSPWLLQKDHDISSIEPRAAELRTKITNFNQLVGIYGAYDESYYQITNVADKIGGYSRQGVTKAMGSAYHYAREYGLEHGTKAPDSDAYVYGFYNAGGYNVVPYFDSFSLAVSDNARADMFEKDAPMLYYIRDLVSTDQEAVNIANKLGQNGKEYSLASTDDLSYTGAVSNVTINVSIDDLSQVAGKNILIKNGSKIVKVLPITAAAMKVSLPIGIYEIEAPDANSYYGYLKEKNYDCLLAKEGSVSKEIKYEKQSSFSPLSDILETRLYGAKNYPFAVLSYSSSDEEFTLTTMEGMPNKDLIQKYATIQVLDDAGNLIYTKEYYTNQQYPFSVEKIPAKQGYQLLLWCDEAGHCQMINTRTGCFESQYFWYSDRQVYFTVTKYGIMKTLWSEAERKQRYTEELEALKSDILASVAEADRGDLSRYKDERVRLMAAVNILDEPERTDQLNSLKDFLVDADKPVTTKQSVVIGIAGKDGKQFAAGTFDAANMTFTVSSSAGQVSSDSTDNYVTITVKDAQGNVRMTRSFAGNEVLKALSGSVNVTAGDTVTIYSAAKSALSFTDKNSGADLNAALRPTIDNANTVYTVKDSGLARGTSTAVTPEPAEPEVPETKGTGTNITFKGLEQYASAVYDAKAGTFTMKTEAKTPYAAYGDGTIELVRILSADGTEKYCKEFIGNKAETAAEETVKLSDGDTLVICGYRNKLSFQDISSGADVTSAMKPDKDYKNTVYSFTDKGLSKNTGTVTPPSVDPDPVTPEPETKGNGTNISFAVREQYASAVYDAEARTFTVKTEAVTPYAAYADTTIEWVRIIGADGTVKYNKEFIGDKAETSSEVTVQLSDGDKLSICGYRNELKFQDINSKADVTATLKPSADYRNTLYSFTSTGLVKETK